MRKRHRSSSAFFMQNTNLRVRGARESGSEFQESGMAREIMKKVGDAHKNR